VSAKLSLLRNSQTLSADYANLPIQIEEPHLIQIAVGKAAAQAVSQITGELLEELLSIFRPPGAALLVFYDSLPDQPVGRSQNRINGADSADARPLHEIHQIRH
jgi:hypothetical protein